MYQEFAATVYTLERSNQELSDQLQYCHFAVRHHHNSANQDATDCLQRCCMVKLNMMPAQAVITCGEKLYVEDDHAISCLFKPWAGRSSMTWSEEHALKLEGSIVEM